MSTRTSRKIHLHMPSSKPKRRMGSASPQMRSKKGQSQRNSKKHRHHHHGGAIILDSGAKPKQRVHRDSQTRGQTSTENHQVEIHRKEWEVKFVLPFFFKKWTNIWLDWNLIEWKTRNSKCSVLLTYKQHGYPFLIIRVLDIFIWAAVYVTGYMCYMFSTYVVSSITCPDIIRGLSTHRLLFIICCRPTFFLYQPYPISSCLCNKRLEEKKKHISRLLPLPFSS